MLQNYRFPPISAAIVTYELADKEWVATVTHVFHGETMDHIYGLIEAHRKTDTFFDGSFKGRYNGIILKNGPIELL